MAVVYFLMERWKGLHDQSDEQKQLSLGISPLQWWSSNLKQELAESLNKGGRDEYIYSETVEIWQLVEILQQYIHDTVLKYDLITFFSVESFQSIFTQCQNLLICYA